MQGFSVDWWKSKHNTHHAAPNELADDGARVVDPDIDTLPLLVRCLAVGQRMTQVLSRLKADGYTVGS